MKNKNGYVKIGIMIRKMLVYLSLMLCFVLYADDILEKETEYIPEVVVRAKFGSKIRKEAIQIEPGSYDTITTYESTNPQEFSLRMCKYEPDLEGPRGIAVRDDTIYIFDPVRFCIVKYSTKGKFLGILRLEKVNREKVNYLIGTFEDRLVIDSLHQIYILATTSMGGPNFLKYNKKGNFLKAIKPEKVEEVEKEIGFIAILYRPSLEKVNLNLNVVNLIKAFRGINFSSIGITKDETGNLYEIGWDYRNPKEGLVIIKWSRK